MDTMKENLPGEVIMAICLITGLGIIIPMLKIPQTWLQEIGKTRFLSPNWISFWRVPIFWIGVLIYQWLEPFTGYHLIVFALGLDRLDGAVAEALALLNDPEHPGITALGEWLDAFLDKLTITAFLAVMWARGFYYAELMIPMLISEFASTVIRPPFMPDREGKEYLFQKEGRIAKYLQTRIRSSASNGPGKIKALLQCMALLACLPTDQHWMSYSKDIPNAILALALLFGLMSTAGRFKIHARVDSVVDTFSAAFKRTSKA